MVVLRSLVQRRRIFAVQREFAAANHLGRSLDTLLVEKLHVGIGEAAHEFLGHGLTRQHRTIAVPKFADRSGVQRRTRLERISRPFVGPLLRGCVRQARGRLVAHFEDEFPRSDLRAARHLDGVVIAVELLHLGNQRHTAVTAGQREIGIGHHKVILARHLIDSRRIRRLHQRNIGLEFVESADVFVKRLPVSETVGLAGDVAPFAVHRFGAGHHVGLAAVAATDVITSAGKIVAEIFDRQVVIMSGHIGIDTSVARQQGIARYAVFGFHLKEIGAGRCPENRYETHNQIFNLFHVRSVKK